MHRAMMCYYQVRATVRYLVVTRFFFLLVPRSHLIHLALSCCTILYTFAQHSMLLHQSRSDCSVYLVCPCFFVVASFAILLRLSLSCCTFLYLVAPCSISLCLPSSIILHHSLCSWNFD